MRSTIALLALFSALSMSASSAQQPAVQHAQASTQPLSGTLTQTLAALEKNNVPQWVGYTVPTAHPFNSGWGNQQITYLERNDTHRGWSDQGSTSQNHAAILVRLAGGRIDQLRAESAERPLDAGDLHFTWLTSVTPEDSVATLQAIALAPDTKRLRDNAVFLISLHQSTAATPALLALAAPGRELALREKAAFWLANERGHEGFLAIQRLDREDVDPAFREKLTFDLTLTKDTGALDELVRMAHEDASPRVRSQAQFWMAQSARKFGQTDGGKRVADSLRRDAESDPDTQARRQAVFAISRLPGAEAVTQLTQLATTSTHPEVREQAVFWLGQSRDPRALEYLTKLLKSDSAR